MPRKLRTDPEILEMPRQRMAVVHTTGDPNDLGETVFKALYGAVYALKFARKKEGADFKVSPPRARWFGGPDWRSLGRDEWKAIWGLPIPDDVDEVTGKVPEPQVVVETWEYGTVAQILHLGTYAEELPTIERLHAFIADEGYEIVGPHEEEYLSRPGSKEQKTLIRYQVRPRQEPEQ